MVDSPFSRRTLYWMIGISLVSLVGAFFAAALDPGQQKVEVGPSTYSDSALGHGILAEALRKLDVPVLVSRSGSAAKAAERGVLVIAEPRLGETQDGAELLENMAREPGVLLLVLPKRSGTAGEDEPRFIESVEALSLETVQHVLETVAPGASVVRGEAVTDWEVNEFEHAPTLDAPQLVRGGGIEPWIACEDGILLGRLEESDDGLRDHAQHFVLSDPDLIANHGLVRGDNAALTLAILDHLRGETKEGAVVFDESLHGYRGSDSFLAELARFPLILVTLQAIVCGVLFAWAGVRRFGAPRPPRSLLEEGKDYLLDNSARLVLTTGQSSVMLRPYLDDALRQVAKRLCQGRSEDERAALVARLEGIGRRRGVTTDLTALTEEVLRISGRQGGSAGEIRRVASEIHRWRVAMIGGASRGE